MKPDCDRRIQKRKSPGRAFSGSTALAAYVVGVAALTMPAPPAFGQLPPEVRQPAGARQPLSRRQERALADRVRAGQKTFRKPSDPEAAAVLLNLIARYAANVPDKTDLDRQIEAALGDSSQSRQIAQRMIDRFHKIPAQFRQEAYGQYANVTTQPFERTRYEAALGRVMRSIKIDAAPASPRSYSQTMSLGTEPTYTLRYQGMACFAETDWDQSSGSDEIYAINTVVSLENGQPVTKTFKQPSTKEIYAPVDGGGGFPGPVVTLYEGPTQDLGLSSAWFEQDFGNASEQRDMINTGVKTGLTAACTAALGKACAAAPISMLVGFVSNIIGDLIADILDFEDDLISEVHLTISRDQVVGYGVAQPPPLDDRGIRHHFNIHHEGQGAFYKAYFDIARTDPDIPDLGGSPPPPPRGFLPALQASARDVEGTWGDAASEDSSKIVVIITGAPSGSGNFSVRGREHVLGGSDLPASANGLQLTTDGTWSYIGPLYDTATLLKTAPGGAVRGTDALGGLSGARATAGSDGRTPGGRAYTLLLPNNVRLQSFIEDRPPEEVKNYRIRYVRLNDQGRIVADVMLRRTQMRPR